MPNPKLFTVQCYNSRNNSTRDKTGTIDELISYFSYTLETGKSYQHEKGNKKINCKPTTITQLVNNLNNAVSNAAANGHASKTYKSVESVTLLAQ